MPEIKNTFTQGKMNKDLDERIIPNGQYRDAMNVQVSTSEGSDIGTVQNILGNESAENVVDISGAKCIGSVSNEKTNKLYWFIKSNNVDAILEFSEDSGPVSVLIDTKAGTVDAVLKFPNSIITGINIIDNLLLWTDGVNEPKRINIERCKLGNLTLTSLSSASHTKLVVGGSVVTDSYGVEVEIKEEHITSIKKNPLRPLGVVANEAEVDSLTGKSLNKTHLFEKIFPRFSYRYKYEDGEYSTYAPFTDVVFKSSWGEDPAQTLYDVNDAYGTKEPYNNAMRNMLESVELKDFISPSMPEDVVQVDLLYKQEDSSVIYILEVIRNNDEEWGRVGMNPNSSYKGSFTVTSENIYAALPENQLLRPWDSIPKSALAQEVTGNRVVYGNYKQAYDMPTVPKVESSFGSRGIVSESGGLPSVKSQRDYQVGIIYGDKYGRETPVFTSEPASLTVPWGLSSPNSLSSQQLKSTVTTPHPEWASYYKFFVKETSGEYYNLVMDAIYTPTKEDLSKEDHVWLSFASSDRNKISEDDYIILKKKVGVNAVVEEENKYKVLDIKNEAPDSIKYKYLNLGEMDNLLQELNNDIFDDSDLRPAKNKNFIRIRKTNWHNPPSVLQNPGMSLTIDDTGDTNKIHDLYVSFYKGSGSSVTRSERFKISAIRVSNNNLYEIHLEKPLPEDFDDNYHASSTTTNELHANTNVIIERKIVKDLEAFSGRFFAKVFKGGVIDQLQDSNAIQESWNVKASQEIHWHADTPNTSGYDPDTGLINNGSYTVSSLASSDRTITVANITQNLTNNQTGWENLLTEVENNQFFIDNMYMASAQQYRSGKSNPGYARLSGHNWNGGSPNPVDDIIYGGIKLTANGNEYTSWGPNQYQWNHLNDNFPGYHHHMFKSGSTIHPTLSAHLQYQRMAFPLSGPAKAETILSDPGSSGENMINGLPGIVDLDDAYTSSTGIRRWKKDLFSDDLTNWDYGNHPSHNGRKVIHLSFLAPGEDLHTGFSSDLTADLSGTTGVSERLQGIHGGGVFTSVDGTHFVACEEPHKSQSGGGIFLLSNAAKRLNKIVTDFVDELTPHGDPNYHVYGYDPNYDDKHDKQWKPEWSGGVYNESVDRFIKALDTKGQRFRFLDDASNAVYTVKRIKVKNIYNHTPWRRMYKSDGSGGVVAKGDSVEEYAIAWKQNPTDTGKRDAFQEAVVRFGSRDNRRTCYILHLDEVETTFPVSGGIDPRASAQTGLGAASLFNSKDSYSLQLIDKDFSLLDGSISENPAIWETEPKDNVDLDIYHEASQAHATSLTIENIELSAPIGSSVFIDIPGAITPGNEIKIASWDVWDSNFSTGLYSPGIIGDLVVTLDTPINGEDANGGVIDYVEKTVRFHRDDGSFISLQITDVTGDIWPNIDYLVLKTGDHHNQPHGLSWYNCFSFGNGIESDRIRDDFNGMTLSNGVRASTTLDVPYAEEHRESGLIYSGIYNSTSSVNNLNQFIAAEKITKDLSPTYGSIQKLFQRRISLIAFCEDRVVGIVAGKHTLYNADGNPQLIATNRVLGDAQPFVGDYGISKNPESFAKESYRAYFTDKQRGAVLRLSMDGITPISDAGMHDYFRDNLKTAEKIIGTYDDYKKDYNLTLVTADFLPENVVSNSEFEEGSGTNTEFPNDQEYITNGNFANGNNVVNPSPPTNVASNTDLNSITTITKWPGINVGNIVPQVQYQAPDPPTATPGAGAVFGGGLGDTPQAESPINVWTWDGNTNPFTNANIGTPGASNVIKTESGITSFGAGNIYWLQGGPAHPYHQSLIWRQTPLKNDWLEFDLDKLPSDATTGIGTNVPTTTNGDSESVASLYGGKDNTFYNGEEIRIKFKVKQSDTSNSWSNKPTMSVSLYNGPVDNSGNLVPGTKLQQITTGSPPYENIENNTVSSTLSPTPPSSPTTEWTPGFTSSNPYTFPTLNVGDYEERWFWVYYKICDGTTNEGIVINDLRVKLEVAENDVKLATDEFIIERVYQLQVPEYEGVGIGSITAEVPAVSPVPPSNVSAWAEVEHTAVNGWSASNSNLILNDFAVGEYGPDTGSGTTVTYDVYNEFGAVTGTDTYIVGTPNNDTTYNEYTTTTNVTSSSGWSNTGTTGDFSHDGRLEASTNGTPGNTAFLTQDISTRFTNGTTGFVLDNWYEVKLTGVNETGGNGGILVSDALDPSTFPAGWQVGNTLPGHLGTISDGSNKLIRFSDEGGGVWIARWQQKDTGGDLDELKILFNHFSGTVGGIEFADISGVVTGGGANDWSLGGNDPIYHYYSPAKTIYFDNSKIVWDNGVYGNYITQSFSSESTPQLRAQDIDSSLPVTEDGYELRFLMSNYVSGTLSGYVTGAEGATTPNSEGFEFGGIEEAGYYRVLGNFDGDTIPTIEKCDSSYVPLPTASQPTSLSASIKTNYAGTYGHTNKVVFKVPSGDSFSGRLSDVSLKDITNYFTSASVDGWSFVGFDAVLENYITWDDINENISFTNAPVGTSIQQALPNTNFVNGATVEFNFDANITPGSISGYFYNGSGEGFTFGPVTGTNGYNGTHVIGGNPVTGTTALLATQLGVLETSILRETLVIHVDTELVNGTIDNFALYRIYPEITPSTVTYSEDTKGWVSFKSFIPESGLSLSKDYYTMKDGKLWQHHSNEIRNWFYGEKDENDNPSIAESTITAMLNAEPSLIKIFNTLNYEGSQSKINPHTTQDVFDANGSTVTLSNAEVYNLNAKDGWCVDSIITDKQSGSIQEFIEKEGKWFNYIKGTVMTETTLPSTADLSFQGLGMVLNTTT